MTAIAIVGGFGLSRARAGRKVVISSFEELYGVAERSTRQLSEPEKFSTVFLATAVLSRNILGGVYSAPRVGSHVEMTTSEI